ncbi:MAG: imidazole glycerol-phosphate synthase subunit HisH [Chloroflexota bacterium]|nr:imidazole glycerol-phosphate synthase subunit HisH [Chloroflexota bacterium]
MAHDLVVIDYGAGNLRSVAKAIASLGYEPLVSSDAADVAQARALVLPGVGAAGQIMRSLQTLELDDAVRHHVATGKPFLGVCMGMQVLMDRSDEDGGQTCLGILNGDVARLPGDGLKIPHMGWNAVAQVQPHPLWVGIPDGSYFYFVHSFAVRPTDEGIVAGRTEYGVPFVSAMARDNLFCTQFHPEKSGRFGLQLYRNFVEWAFASSPR